MDAPMINVGDFSLNPNTFHTGTDLHTAAVNGDKVTIERLLRQQDVVSIQALNEGDKYGRTALVYTVFGEWYECAEILVRHGASVLQVDSDRRSVLHWAAYLNRPKFIKLFLDHVGSNLEWNLSDKGDRTALHYAAMQENPKCLRLLLKLLKQNNRTLNSTDDEGMSALHWSVFYNRLENLKLLLRESADTTKRDGKGRCLLHMAVLNPNADSIRIVRILLKHNRHYSRQIDCEGRTALHLAVANGNEELVRELCTAEESALNDFDHLNRSALHYAILKNNLNLVNILITAGVSPYHLDNTGASVLHYAAKNNNVPILNRFLGCFKNFEDSPDRQGRTALMWAASEGATDVLSAMLRNKTYCNIHESDDQGLSALHFACLAGHEKCVQLLISNSANINQPDNLGQTPLFKACQQGHRNIIDVLVDPIYRKKPEESNNNPGTFVDRQVMLKGNAGQRGKNLSAILEETADSFETFKNSQWSHEPTESSPEEAENHVNEKEDSPPRGKELISGDYATQGAKSDKLNHKRDIYLSQNIKNAMKDAQTNSTALDLNASASEGFNDVSTNENLKPGVEASGDHSSGIYLRIRELEDENGCTPLHFAAHAGHTPVCKWLLSQGVDPRKKDTQGRTALHGAAFNGHTECMELILADCPKLVNDRDNDGYSVLHHAAINGQLEAVKLLVSKPYSACPNYRVKSTDWTPLDFAMAADHQDVTQFLMDNRGLTIAWVKDLAADTIKRFFRRLVDQRREATLKPLIERHEKLTKEDSLKHRENETETKNVNQDDVMNDDVNDRQTVAFDSHVDDDAIKNELVSNEAMMNMTCSKMISEDDRVKSDDEQSGTVTKSVSRVDPGANTKDDPSTTDGDQSRTTTKSDWSTKYDDQVGSLINIYDEIKLYDSPKQILLLDACYHGNLERVQELAQENVNLNYCDENGCTALHFAAGQGHDNICEYLLRNGTEIYKRDINGRTALHNAAIAGNLKSISLLLSQNNELIFYLDHDGKTALHYAASLGHLEAVKIFLSEESGVQVLCAKSALLTPFDCAILAHHVDVTEYLLSKGGYKSGLLDRAARVIQRNFRKWKQHEIFSATARDNYSKRNAENGRRKTQNDSRNDKAKILRANNREFGHETSSGYQTTPTSTKSTSEAGNDCRPTERNRMTKEDLPEKSISEKKYKHSETIQHVHPKRSQEPPSSTPVNRERTREPSSTFAQTNVEKLSRAPESVVTASGKKDTIIELRNNWERIAQLRRKKQAALVIQSYYRQHFKNVKSGDKIDEKNTSNEYRTSVNKESIKNKVNKSESLLDESPPTSDSEKSTEKNVLKLNEKDLSSDVYSPEVSTPKRLNRKTVVNRLRALSPEYSSSENEPFREKRQHRYKSTFPLLSPRSSSASSNGRSPSNVSINQLPNSRHESMPTQLPSNKRVDVAPLLTKNQYVSQWLSDGMLSEDSSREEDWNTRNKNRSKYTQLLASENGVREHNIKSRSVRKTDPPKGGPRRMSSQSARIRRESLVKNVYGSPAAHSYNFALDTYHPLVSRCGRKDQTFPFKTSSRVRPHSMKRVGTGWVRTADYQEGSSVSESRKNN